MRPPLQRKRLMLLPMEMQLPRMEKIQLPLMEMIQLPLMEKIQLPLMETIQLPRMEKIQRPLMEMIQLPRMEKIQRRLMEMIQLPRMAKIQRRLMETIQLPRMEKIQLPLMEQNLQRVNPLMLVTMPRVQMVLTVMQKHRLKNLQGELEEVKVGMMTYQQRLRKQKRVKRSLTRLLQS